MNLENPRREITPTEEELEKVREQMGKLLEKRDTILAKLTPEERERLDDIYNEFRSLDGKYFSVARVGSEGERPSW